MPHPRRIKREGHGSHSHSPQAHHAHPDHINPHGTRRRRAISGDHPLEDSLRSATAGCEHSAEDIPLGGAERCPKRGGPGPCQGDCHTCPYR